MFRRLPSTAPRVEIFVDGRAITARSGDTVAAALLADGQNWTREAANAGTRRGPYCLIGHCHECLVEIDGQPGQHACLVTVRDGMRVVRTRRMEDGT